MRLKNGKKIFRKLIKRAIKLDNKKVKVIIDELVNACMEILTSINPSGESYREHKDLERWNQELDNYNKFLKIYNEALETLFNLPESLNNLIQIIEEFDNEAHKDLVIKAKIVIEKELILTH